MKGRPSGLSVICNLIDYTAVRFNSTWFSQLELIEVIRKRKQTLNGHGTINVQCASHILTCAIQNSQLFYLVEILHS